MTLEQTIETLTRVERTPIDQAKEKFSQLAIPLDSLGTLQELVYTICGITGSLEPNITQRAVVVFCADHGVVAQGVSQVGSDVTTAVAKKLCTRETVMCRMAALAKATVIPVDIGMKTPVEHEAMWNYAIATGTKDFFEEQAMTRDQAIKSIEIGIEVASRLKDYGFQLLVAGEMGIGNTTAASAMTSALLGCPPRLVTGAGSGLSSKGISHKIRVISHSLLTHRPNADDVIDVLSKVGGFEIGGMIGLMLGCALEKIPCVVDGAIGNLAALCGVRLWEHLGDYLIYSHQSAEPAGEHLLKELGVIPLLRGNMRLGEGSGGVALLPLLDMGLACFQEGITFDGMEIPPYQPKDLK